VVGDSSAIAEGPRITATVNKAKAILTALENFKDLPPSSDQGPVAPYALS